MQLYFSFSILTGKAMDVLAAAIDWMRANKLRLNPDKTEMLLVGGSSDWVVGVQPVLDGVALPLKEQVRSLGFSWNHLCHLRRRWPRWHLRLPSCAPIRTGIT